MGWKEKTVAVVLIGILSIFVFDAMIVFPWEISGPPEHSCVWAISDGDAFIFNATLESDGYHESYPPELSVVAGETILATIWYLENFTGEVENQFIAFMESPKVSCTFANGSILPSDTKLTIDQLISRQFFPIGGWEYFDWLFPDTFEELQEEIAEHSYSYWTYLSRITDEYFFFGYTSLFIDHYTRWGGTTSMATGIPNLIFTSWWSSMSSYNFSMNLVAVQRNQY